MKLSKIKIEELVKEIEEFLKEHELIGDVCIYFNNKRHLWHSKYDQRWNFLGFGCDVQEGISPLDYFEYVNVKHILSMSFEGAFYHVLNGYDDYADKLQQKFSDILNKYNLYYELGNAWNLTCYLIYDDMEVEFTDYSQDVKPEPEFIYLGKDNIPTELVDIMKTWYLLSKETGDKGCCVIGAGMNFEYQGIPYKMTACSPWQGENSWTPHVDAVKEMLRNIGATNISWNCGRMD